jgi:bifunctional ADP-heptose synthase (sugar kinase/adenylyltransferase)
MKFLVIGDVMLDAYLDVKHKENYEGAKHSFIGQKFLYKLGAAANVAYILKGQGHDIMMCGAIAPDWGGQYILDMFGLEERMFYMDLPASILKIRAIQDDEIIVRLDCEQYKESACLELAYAKSDFDAVILSDYHRGVFHANNREIVANIVQGLDCPIVSDPHFYSIKEVMEDVTVITPNLLEFTRLNKPLISQWTAVTRGSDGVSLYDGKTLYAEYACNEVIENPEIVGAGDAFTAGMAIALGTGQNVPDAVHDAMRLTEKYIQVIRYKER